MRAPACLQNCVVQLLCLLQPVMIESRIPGGSPFNEDFRMFQVELQNATLVTIFPPLVGGSRLQPSLNNISKRGEFHVVLLSGTAPEGASETASSIEYLMALFTSPAKEQLQLKGFQGFPTYQWRFSMIQLLPEVIQWKGRGLGADVDGESNTIRFTSHDVQGEQAVNITVDFASGSISTSSGPDVPLLNIKSIRSYRLPGHSTLVTTYPSAVSPVSSPPKAPLKASRLI
jgi:hypothetical protein